MLTGIKKVEARSGPPERKRFPITIDVLHRLKDIWLSAPRVPDNNYIMLWAAACVGFFVFLRAGEFTVSAPQAYDPDVHLNLSDLALDSHTNPSVVQLRIKQSKTDLFRQGINIFLGKTDVAGPYVLFRLSSNTSRCAVLILAPYSCCLKEHHLPGVTLSHGYKLPSGEQAWTIPVIMATIFAAERLQ